MSASLFFQIVDADGKRFERWGICSNDHAPTREEVQDELREELRAGAVWLEWTETVTVNGAPVVWQYAAYEMEIERRESVERVTKKRAVKSAPRKLEQIKMEM